MASAIGYRSLRNWLRVAPRIQLAQTPFAARRQRAPLSTQTCVSCQNHRVRLALENRRHFHFSVARRGQIIQFPLADIGEGISEVTVKEWYVKVGDRVQQFDNIVEVQSDKSAATITSRFDGVVRKLYYEVDDLAKKDLPLVDIELDGSADVSSAEEPALSGSTASEGSVESTDSETSAATKVLATPAVRRIAREHNVNLAGVEATGHKGRVLKEDILRYIALQKGDVVRPSAVSPPAPDSVSDSVWPAAQDKAPVPTHLSPPPVPARAPAARQDYVQPIRGFRKAMVKTMTAANSIPTFGYSDEINVTELWQLHKELKGLFKDRGLKLTLIPFVVKAVSLALHNYPVLNSSPDSDCTSLTFKASHNVGIAMDTPEGLVVPNIKSVQDKSIYEIATELRRLMELGAQGKLSTADLTGGTMSLSNIGAIGGTYARPVLLPPEVLIGAIGKVQTLPRFDKDENVVKANILNISWSADHRVIDGATVARFSNLWKSYMENPSRMLVDLR